MALGDNTRAAWPCPAWGDDAESPQAACQALGFSAFHLSIKPDHFRGILVAFFSCETSSVCSQNSKILPEPELQPRKCSLMNPNFGACFCPHPSHTSALQRKPSCCRSKLQTSTLTFPFCHTSLPSISSPKNGWELNLLGENS